jgi:hypothetical protein
MIHIRNQDTLSSGPPAGYYSIVEVNLYSGFQTIIFPFEHAARVRLRQMGEKFALLLFIVDVRSVVLFVHIDVCT